MPGRKSMRGILDHGHAVLRREGMQRVAVNGQTGEVHGNDCLRRGGSGAFGRPRCRG